MKKWGIVLSILLVVVLGISAWYYGYYNRKSNDNIPSKELMLSYCQNQGVDYASEQLQGYKNTQLMEVWGEPDRCLSGLYGHIWEINNTYCLTVLYDPNYVVVDVHVTVRNEDDIPQSPIIESEKDALAIVNIIDRTKTEGLPYDMAEEKFFEDGDNEYYFSGIYSHYVIVHYEDGSQEDVVTALSAGRATIADLDKFEVSYIVKPLGMEIAELPDNPISQTGAEE